MTVNINLNGLEVRIKVVMLLLCITPVASQQTTLNIDTRPSLTITVPVSRENNSQLSTQSSTKLDKSTSSAIVFVEDFSSTTKHPVAMLPEVFHKSPVRNYPWVIALIVIASIGILIVVGLEVIILFRVYGTPLWLDWKSLWLGQILMFAIFCSYLTQFAFIPYPSVTTCYIIRFCVGVSYGMAYSVLVVKLLVIIFRSAELHHGFQAALFLALWAVQIVIDIQWLISNSAKLSRHSGSRDGYVCDPGYKQHVQSLVYIMLLIVLCVFLSLLTHRRRSAGRLFHTDGLLIGISSGLSAAVWIVWILLGFLKNNENWHDPCIAFGLEITATILLVFLIMPKVYKLKKIRKALLTDAESQADSKDTKKSIDFFGHESVRDSPIVAGQQFSNDMVEEGNQNQGIEYQTNGVIGNGGVEHVDDNGWTSEDVDTDTTMRVERRFYQIDSSQYDSDPPASNDTRISYRTSGRYQQSGLRSHHPQWGVLNAPSGHTRRGSTNVPLNRSSSLHSYHHRSHRGTAPSPYHEPDWPEGERRYRVAALYSARSDSNGVKRWNLSEPDLTVLGRSSTSSSPSPKVERHRYMARASSMRHQRYRQPVQHRLGVQPPVISSIISIN